MGGELGGGVGRGGFLRAKHAAPKAIVFEPLWSEIWNIQI